MARTSRTASSGLSAAAGMSDPLSPASENNHWTFDRRPKYAASGVERSVPPSTTIRRAAPLMALAGVTRIADITGLDRVGIPNFTSVRPREAGEGISYYNGKGVTRAAAQAGAMMEAIERYSAEALNAPVVHASFAQVGAHHKAIDPRTVCVPSEPAAGQDDEMAWLAGFDLLTREAVLVPASLIACPYLPSLPGEPVFCPTSNGLASGNTLVEAVCHGLCEVLERDALSLAAAVQQLGPIMKQVLRGTVPTASLPTKLREPADYPLLSGASMPDESIKLVRLLEAASLSVYVRDVSSIPGIPVFECTVVELRPDGYHWAHSGAGCHPDSRVALTRALTEAAQSRLGHIQGGREDLPRIIGAPSRFDPESLFGHGNHRDFASVPSQYNHCIADDVEWLLACLRREHLGPVVAVDLTRVELGVPVVRIVIPKTESWSTFVSHGRVGVLGSRASWAAYMVSAWAAVVDQRPGVAKPLGKF